jgi:hypothetical protein
VSARCVLCCGRPGHQRASSGHGAVIAHALSVFPHGGAPQYADDRLPRLGMPDSVKSLLEDSNVPDSPSTLRRPPQKLELFAKSIKEIEALRMEHTHQASR